VTELRNDEDDWTVTDAKIARKNAEIGELRQRITIYEALDKVTPSSYKKSEYGKQRCCVFIMAHT
jgi:hypothetical protein